MSVNWDSKAIKGTPIGADEVLIIDTENTRNQKRATLSSLPGGALQTPWLQNIDGAEFNLINVGLLNLKIDNATANLELEANHSAPAADDIIGNVSFFDDDSVGARREYGRIRTRIDDPLSSQVNGELFIDAMRNGVSKTYIAINQSSSDNVAIGANLFMGSNAIRIGASGIPSSGVIRIPNNDRIAWRNAADNQDHLLFLDSNDTFVFRTPLSGTSLSQVSIKSQGTAVIDQDIAELHFEGDDASALDTIYAQIIAGTPAIVNNSEEGSLRFVIRETGNSLQNYLFLNQDEEGTVKFLRDLDMATNNAINFGTLNTHTIPGGTDTFAMIAATQAITNKTFNNTNEFEDNGLIIQNPANTFNYIFQSAAIITANRTITLPLLGGNDTMVTEAFAQTLTNKTMTAAANTFSGFAIGAEVSGASTDLTDTAVIVRTDQTNTYGAIAQIFPSTQLQLQSNGNEYIFAGSAIVADRTVTLPLLAGNDVFVFEAFAATLTNKTINTASNTITVVSADVSDLDTSTVTFSNKTIDGDVNTIIDINETQMNVDTGASGTVLTSTGVGNPPTYQAAAGGEFTGAWTANHNQGGSTFSLEDARFADPTDDTKTIQMNLAGMTTAIELTISTSQSTAQTLTIPNITAADVLATEAFAQTLTNKTMTLGNNTISGTAAEFDTAVTDDNFMFDAATNVVTGAIQITAGTMRIALSATPTMAVDGDFAIDTDMGADFSHGFIKYFDGEELVVVSMPVAEFTTPPDGGAVTYNATNDEFELVVPAGSGDMVLADVQTVTGAKTFEDGTFLLRNVADTFSVEFNNTVTAARVYELPDASGTMVITGLASQITIGTEVTGASTALTDTADIAYLNQANTFGAFLNSFTGSTMRIPLSATPTMAVDGDFAIDTLVTDWSHGILKYFDGEELGAVVMPIAEFTTPASGAVPTYNATNDEFEMLVPSGSGDMILASAQTNTGIKTFLDTTMKLRNVANTFDAFFVNTVTADRIITIPDAAGTMVITGLADQLTNTELTSGVFAKITGVGAQSQTLDLNGNNLDAAADITLTGTLNLSNNEQIQWAGSADRRIFNSTAGMVFEVEASDIFDFQIAGATELTLNSTALTLSSGNDLVISNTGNLQLGSSLETIGIEAFDMIFDVTVGDTFNFDIATVNEYTFSATQLDLQFNKLADIGTTTITDLATVTGVSGDFVWIIDATDGLSKKVDVLDFLGGGEFTGAWTANHNQGGSTFSLEDARFADPTDDTKTIQMNLAGMTTAIELTISTSQSTAQTLTIPNITAADVLVTENFTQTLAGKTLTTPTIASFANAGHDHTAGAGGGQLTNTALTSGVFSAITGVGTQTQALEMGDNAINNVDFLEIQASPTATDGQIRLGNNNFIAYQDQFGTVDQYSALLLTGNDFPLWRKRASSTDVDFAIMYNDSLSAVVDNSITRFNGTTSASVQTSLITISDLGAFGLPNNVKQIFDPGTNNAGINVGEQAADPDTPVDGDMYYQTSVGLRARIESAWVTLGAGGEVFTWTANHSAADFDFLSKPTPSTDFFENLCEITVTDDAGTEPMYHINLRRDTPAAVVTRNLFEISNNDVPQLTMLNNGNVDFEGNTLTNIGDITSITNLNGVAIGNYILTTDNTFDTAGTGLTSTGSTVNAIGTASRISVSADAIDIDSGYVGQASITTLGTIGTGTWQGDVVASAFLDADTMHLSVAQIITGAKTFGGAGDVGKLIVAGTTSGTTVLDATAVASGTLTLPAATDTLVGKDTTDIFTNKSYDLGGTGNVLTGSVAEFNTALQSESFAFIGTANAWGTVNQNIAATGQWQEGGVAISPIGVHDIPISATSMWLTTNTPATGPSITNLATNDIDINTMQFTSTTLDETVQFEIPLPRNYNNGAITIQYNWSFASGSGDVVWITGAVAVGDNEAIDAAFAVHADLVDTAGTANQLQQVTSASFTPAGTPADANAIHFEVMRQGSDSLDTFSGIARLHSIVVRITTDAAVAA